MKTGGVYYGINWFSTQYSEFRNGCSADDIWTRTGYQEGPFADTGKVHFSDRGHLLDLFHQFEVVALQHYLVTTEIPVSDRNSAYWNIVARKR
ncbi:MAG: hypothetical protein HQL58_10390, partial [Magnetococcales bacterium]|nr:hypothetical protein [Magnetococcales bacterium]